MLCPPVGSWYLSMVIHSKKLMLCPPVGFWYFSTVIHLKNIDQGGHPILGDCTGGAGLLHLFCTIYDIRFDDTLHWPCVELPKLTNYCSCQC